MTAHVRLKNGHNSGLDPLPEITNIREVTRADLAHLTVKREATVVQTLRDNHHRLARAVASGMSNADVAAACGVSLNRVSSLKSDPAFAELVAHYRALVTSEWAQEDTVIQFLRGNALKAQAMLSDKLDEAAERGEFLPTRDLLGIAELGLDRTGYGKVNKNINVNVDFAAKLEAARNRASRASEVRQIEGNPTPSHGEPRAIPEVAMSRQPQASGPIFEIEASAVPALAPQSAEAPAAQATPMAPRPSFRRV